MKRGLGRIMRLLSDDRTLFQPTKTMIGKLITCGALMGVCVGLASAAESLIQNGEFEKPLKPWKVFSLKDTPGTEKDIAEGVLTVKALGASDKPGNRQLSQEVAVEVGKTYSLSFDVKGQLEKGKEVVVVVTTGPGKFAYFNRVPVTAEWATKKLRITPKETDGDKPPTLKFLMGDLKGEVSLRKVSLEPVE